MQIDIFEDDQLKQMKDEAVSNIQKNLRHEDVSDEFTQGVQEVTSAIESLDSLDLQSQLDRLRVNNGNTDKDFISGLNYAADIASRSSIDVKTEPSQRTLYAAADQLRSSLETGEPLTKPEARELDQILQEITSYKGNDLDTLATLLDNQAKQPNTTQAASDLYTLASSAISAQLPPTDSPTIIAVDDIETPNYPTASPSATMAAAPPGRQQAPVSYDTLPSGPELIAEMKDQADNLIDNFNGGNDKNEQKEKLERYSAGMEFVADRINGSPAPAADVVVLKTNLLRETDPIVQQGMSDALDIAHEQLSKRDLALPESTLQTVALEIELRAEDKPDALQNTMVRQADAILTYKGDSLSDLAQAFKSDAQTLKNELVAHSALNPGKQSMDQEHYVDRADITAKTLIATTILKHESGDFNYDFDIGDTADPKSPAPRI